MDHLLLHFCHLPTHYHLYHEPDILSVILPTSPFPALPFFLLSSDNLLFSYFHHNPSLAIVLAHNKIPRPHFPYVHSSFSLPPVRASRWRHWLLPLTQSDPQMHSEADWRQLVPWLWISTPYPPLSAVVIQRVSHNTRQKLSDAHFTSTQHSTGKQNLDCWTRVHDTRQVLNMHCESDQLLWSYKQKIQVQLSKYHVASHKHETLSSTYWCLSWNGNWKI